MVNQERIPIPTATLPVVVNSMDGKRSLAIHSYETVRRDSSQADSTYGKLVVSSADTDQRSVVQLQIDSYFRALWDDPSQTLRWDIPFERALVDLILIAIGDKLDSLGTEALPSSSLPTIVINSDLFSALQKARATDASINLYLQSKLYWSWRFSILPARFSISDATRLGINTEAIDRIAEVESGNLWEQVAYLSYRPSPTLLRQFQPEQTQSVGSSTSGTEIDVPSPTWDVFISHASEDKVLIARPLAEELRRRGLRVWYDEFSLSLGDSLHRLIDRGLAQSRFGVVVLSKNFFAKEWPQRELDGLTSREIQGKKVILPIWHGIDYSDVLRHSPVLADRVAISSAQGIDVVADVIERVLRQDQAIMSQIADPSPVREAARDPEGIPTSTGVAGAESQGTEHSQPASPVLECPECGSRTLYIEDGVYRCVRCAAEFDFSDGARQVRFKVSGEDAREVADVLKSGYNAITGNAPLLQSKQLAAVDVVVLTALYSELAIFFQQVVGGTPANVTRIAGSPRSFYELESPNGLRVVTASALGMGQLNAALLARDAIQAWRPKHLILVGIAAGIGKDVSLGDVVVSEQIVDYEIGKIEGSETKPRWSVYRSDPELYDAFMEIGMRGWQPNIPVPRPDGKSSTTRIHGGVVLSGNKVIASASAAGALREVWTRARAIEMESAGIAAALYQMDSPPAFIMVKGICDFATEAKDDRWQDYAGAVAAALVGEFLAKVQPSGIVVASQQQASLLRSDVIDRSRLRQVMSTSFDLSELKALAFDMGIDWEDIAGATKTEKVVELLLFLERRGNLEQLTTRLRADPVRARLLETVV